MGERERERAEVEILRKSFDKVGVDFECIGAAGVV
jgi:hypothetical protein